MTKRMLKLRDIDAEAKDIQRALSLSADSTVWEIGTGTGECALALASGIKHVYATDVSPAMLEHARRKAQRRHVGNVTFEEGGFLSGFRPNRPCTESLPNWRCNTCRISGSREPGCHGGQPASRRKAVSS
jgi:SAM-dependent methyltransferase